MSQPELEDIPVEPDEAKDLALHVRNCLRRHTALVKLINATHRNAVKRDVIEWIYRGLVLPALGFVAWKLATLPPAALQAFGP